MIFTFRRSAAWLCAKLDTTKHAATTAAICSIDNPGALHDLYSTNVPLTKSAKLRVITNKLVFLYFSDALFTQIEAYGAQRNRYIGKSTYAGLGISAHGD
ncbi:MAG: hypothetical protein KJO35_03515 [Gammaproteobacteria bacterium]|nr:hypothetical protein [Gammaproteobacteria bacterium]